MTLLTWSNSCSVGVRAMDEQHGILMDAMNELRLAVQRGCGREQMGKHLGGLIELVSMHFRSEEQLMQRSGYPEVEAHRAEHKRLLKLLIDSAAHAERGVNVQLTDLLCLMRDSYLEHIDGPDQRYGPWLNARGVE